LTSAIAGFRIVPDDAWEQMLWHGERRLGPLPARLTDVQLLLADMDERRIDIRAIGTASWLQCYWAESALGQELARATNELVAETVARNPERLVGLASLPLQDVDRAIEELDHAVKTLGLRGVVAGTNINGRYFDEPEFEPLFAELERHGVPVFFHPDEVAGADRMTDYYLTRLVGNPHEATLALARLVLGGVIERHPGVRMCFPMGGGSISLLLGRIEHGRRVRPEARVRTEQSPRESLRACYFDTIMHSPQSLAFAFEVLSPSRFVLGSDYPWDMGEADPVGAVEAVLDGDDRALVLGVTAADLLGGILSPVTGGSR
jgi:aminocarboxymuconate-semialdehyde decarboxylase